MLPGRLRGLRCGECVRVCPTQGLQPSLFEGGLQNLFTPRLVPRLGQCSYTCSACIQVCPTGAIPPISLEEKQTIPIGLASINTDRCLAWGYDTICSVCEEICPLAEKAIRLEDAQAVDIDGNPFFDTSIHSSVKMGCPFALMPRYHEIRERVEFFAEAHRTEGIRIDLCFADWELYGATEWNDAWQ